jgi:hypothetical protein
VGLLKKCGGRKVFFRTGFFPEKPGLGVEFYCIDLHSDVPRQDEGARSGLAI